MKRTLWLLCIIAIAFPSLIHAQEVVNMDMMKKIKDEEQQHSSVTEIAHQLTDVCGPRLTNSPGYKRALNYTTQVLRQWGLVNAGPEAWGEFGKGWSTEQFHLAIKKPYYQPVIAYPVAWTSSTKGAISANVILLDRIDSATIIKMKDQLRGKIVMARKTFTLASAFKPFATRFEDTVLSKLPDEYMVNRKMLDFYIPISQNDYKNKLLLQSLGATALLTTSTNGRDGTLFVDGSPAYSKDYKPAIAEAQVSAEDYLRIERLVQDKTNVELEINAQNNFYAEDLTGYNVVAEIPGTDPVMKNEVVMLGGHLDSWHAGTGATDNAAGCIIAMEAVRILKALGVKPVRTIRIALWGGEEQGLLGSFGYVKKHYGDPADMKLKPEQKNVSAYFNLDNGSGKIRGIYTQNNEKVKDIFAAWLQPFADMGATGVTNSNTGSTDHLSFDAVGIPAFQFIQDPLEYETRTHHSNMDVYDHLSIEDLKQASTIMAAFVYNAAMRPYLLPRKPLPKAERFVFDTDKPL